jgi:hypothetical protein
VREGEWRLVWRHRIELLARKGEWTRTGSFNDGRVRLLFYAFSIETLAFE